MVKQDVNTYEVISEQPYAKVNSAVYDTFYKSYVFTLSTPEMETTGFSLSYVSFDKEHDLIRLKDAQDDYCTAIDNLSTNGKLFLTNEVANNGIILSLKFKHLVKD